MPKTASEPAWKRDGDNRIALSGSWNLLVDKSRRRHLLRELGGLGAPHDYDWDLRQIDTLDSTGALLLWQAWHERLPERLDLSDDQHHLFRWLAGAPPLLHTEEGMRPTWFHRLGHGVMHVLATAGGLLVLAGQLLLDFGYCFRHPRVTPWREVCASIYHVGAGSLLLLGSVGFLIGAVMTVQVGFVLQAFGASSLVIGMMATAVPRELGVVVAGLLLAGRTGSAMTASIGAMHITEEYNALRALGSSPSMRLALPRVLGAAISVPLLGVWTGCAITVGSALAAHAELHINYQLFIDQMVAQIQVVNIWIGLGKGVLFGIIIAWVGCYFGMSSSPDTESMSSHTTTSVVTSITAVLLVDAILGALMTNIGLL